ncbi:MAG: hypothetical protein JO149_01210, partial [Gammaproteobacteria bacterium]|nr:hypothetical protein [Gammaproteobacteria bacterium]
MKSGSPLPKIEDRKMELKAISNTLNVNNPFAEALRKAIRFEDAAIMAVEFSHDDPIGDKLARDIWQGKFAQTNALKGEYD